MIALATVGRKLERRLRFSRPDKERIAEAFQQSRPRHIDGALANATKKQSGHPRSTQAVTSLSLYLTRLCGEKEFATLRPTVEGL